MTYVTDSGLQSGITFLHKLEFLARKWAITDKFHDYLYGNTFEVLTDNTLLTYVLTSAKLDATQPRWVADLANYNFTIKYKSGKTIRDADGLSRIVYPEAVKAICLSVTASMPYVFSLAGDPASQSAAEQHEIPSMQQLVRHVEQPKDEAIRRVVQLLSSRSRLGEEECEMSCRPCSDFSGNATGLRY